MGRRITIVGSGAIGGLLGAYMQMAGEDVLFVDRWAEHVEAMNQHGLTLSGIRGENHLRVKAATPDQIRGELDLVLFACKSHHTEEALKGVLAHITPRTDVVSMQNGFNVELLARHLPARQIVGTVPNYGGALLGPGHLEFVHEGPLHIGELDGSESDRIVALRRLGESLTETHISPNIIGEIWGKQVYFSMITMTALVDAPIKELLAPRRFRLMGGALVREALQVAAAAGVQIPPSASFDPEVYSPSTPAETERFCAHIDELLEMWNRRPVGPVKLVKTGSGVWWDIVYRKRKSETTGLSGAVVQKARELGVAVPANERLVSMVYEIEEGKRQLGWQNLEELAAYMEKVGVVLPT